jgi:hypothetical protein
MLRRSPARLVAWIAFAAFAAFQDVCVAAPAEGSRPPAPVVPDAPAVPAPPSPAVVSAPAPLSESLSGPAKEAYEAARILMNNQDPAGALTKYRVAYDASGDPRLLFDMAVCERDLRAYARMQSLLLRYEHDAGQSLSAAQKDDIGAALSAIRTFVGTIVVTAAEPGVSITVDGEAVGATPLPAPVLLDLGKHTISAKKSGFDPFDRTVEIAGGDEIPVAVVLSPAVHPARLHLVADPGATIILDHTTVARGRFDGTTAPGLHEVQVTAPGKKPYLASLDLHDGETRGLQVTLEDDNRGVSPWLLVAGGTALAVGAVVGGYFLFRTHDEPATAPMGTIPPVILRFGER